MKTTHHFLVSGTVQGVGFRRFVEKMASELGLLGWVRNLNDGRVEALVTGDSVTLEKFGILLNEGPPHSEVTHIGRRDVRAVQSFNDFTVKQDEETPWL